MITKEQKRILHTIDFKTLYKLGFVKLAHVDLQVYDRKFEVIEMLYGDIYVEVIDKNTYIVKMSSDQDLNEPFIFNVIVAGSPDRRTVKGKGASKYRYTIIDFIDRYTKRIQKEIEKVEQLELEYLNEV